jgi:hypothetical protein
MTELGRLKCHGIDIGGLSQADRQHIEELGLNAWLSEAEKAQLQKRITQRSAAKIQNRSSRTRKPCVICGKEFLAKRTDAVYCSDRCKMRGSRNNLRDRRQAGPNVTISEKPGLQSIQP